MSFGFKNLIIMFLLVGLFSFAFFSFSLGFPSLNNANQSIGDNPIINESFGKLEEKLGDLESEAKTQQESLEGTERTFGGGNIILDAIGGVWVVLSSMSLGIFNILFGLIGKVFLGSAFSVVLGTITSIVVILTIVYVWKWIRTGDPD